MIKSDGKWSAFTTWSQCTKTCENGTTHRNRTCTEPTPLHGGKECTGASSQVKLCNTHMCPSKLLQNIQRTKFLKVCEMIMFFQREKNITAIKIIAVIFN